MNNFQFARKKIWTIVNKEDVDFTDVIELQLINLQFMTSIMSSSGVVDTKKIEEFNVFLNKSMKRLTKNFLEEEEVSE